MHKIKLDTKVDKVNRLRFSSNPKICTIKKWNLRSWRKRIWENKKYIQERILWICCWNLKVYPEYKNSIQMFLIFSTTLTQTIKSFIIYNYRSTKKDQHLKKIEIYSQFSGLWSAQHPHEISKFHHNIQLYIIAKRPLLKKNWDLQPFQWFTKSQWKKKILIKQIYQYKWGNSKASITVKTQITHLTWWDPIQK